MPNAPTTDIVKTNCYKYLKVYIQSNQISERTNVKNTIHPSIHPSSWFKVKCSKAYKVKTVSIGQCCLLKSLMHNLKSHDLQVWLLPVHHNRCTSSCYFCSPFLMHSTEYKQTCFNSWNDLCLLVFYTVPSTCCDLTLLQQFNGNLVEHFFSTFFSWPSQYLM